MMIDNELVDNEESNGTTQDILTRDERLLLNTVGKVVTRVVTSQIASLKSQLDNRLLDLTSPPTVNNRIEPTPITVLAPDMTPIANALKEMALAMASITSPTPTPVTNVVSQEPPIVNLDMSVVAKAVTTMMSSFVEAMGQVKESIIAFKDASESQSEMLSQLVQVIVEERTRQPLPWEVTSREEASVAAIKPT